MALADRIADLSDIWKQVSTVFPYFDQRNINWDGAYREYLSKAMEVKTNQEFHLLLAEFMNLLGDGHTDYMFPKELQDDIGYLPFALRFIRNTYCLDAVIPEHEEHLGAKVLSINEVPFDRMIEKIKRYGYHVGNYVSRYKLHQLLPFFLNRKDNVVETSRGFFRFDLMPAKPDHLIWKQQAIPDPYQQLRTGKLDLRLYQEGVLVIKLDDFLYANAVDEIRTVITETTGIKSVIFDLRENIGGMTVNGARIAQLFISGEFQGCEKRTRSMTGVGLASASQIIRWSERTIEKQIEAGCATREEIEESKRYMTMTHYDRYVDTYGSENHVALFSGPCVILTSRHTVSAAEDFIAMFRTNQRAVIVGTETCGTTGTPLMQQLTCGGWMRVCSVGYRLLDGTEFVGCGIKPDIFCEASEEDFRIGYDHVLKEGFLVLRNDKSGNTGITN